MKYSFRLFLILPFCFTLLNTVHSQSELVVRPDIAVMDDIQSSMKTSNIVGQAFDLPASITSTNAGLWQHESQSEIWRLPIKLAGRYGMVIYFERLIMPKGSEIKAYTPDLVLSTPVFTENPNKNVLSFALPLIAANEVILEIKIPLGKRNTLDLSIEKLGSVIVKKLHGDTQQRGFGDAPTCFANANCPEAADWQDQKRSVLRYMTITNGLIGFCSGALVNNTGQDCKNYFLSAEHCSIGASESEFGQHVFYFNYESPDCDNPANEDGLIDQTVIGCSRVAASSYAIEFPPGASDFQLLELNDIPTEYNVYYAGWNRNDVDAIEGNGTIIQHPQADIKKIAFWDNAIPGATSQSHLRAIMIPSDNGEGTTEPAGSGSPFFDVNKLIVANVTHGISGCISDVTNGPPDVSGGKVFSHWGENGTAVDLQLAEWLDPMNTGVMMLDGKNQCGAAAITTPNNIEEILISPNPVIDEFTVKSEYPIQYILIYNALGKQVMTAKNKSTVNVESIAKGAYFGLVYTSEGEYLIRFIKM